MKGIKLIDFLSLYNFRYYNEIEDENERHDTTTVRIYYDENQPAKWFEFGVNDWHCIYHKNDMIWDVLNENILNQYVYYFDINEDTSTLRIYIQKEKEILD